MKRVTNLDWEVTSHRSQVTRSRHIWTDFRARAVSFGRKILLWASIMFAQRLTICEIDAKFSIFLFPRPTPDTWGQVTGKVVLTWRTVHPLWSYRRYGAVDAEDITSDTFCTQAVEAELSQLGNVSLQMMMERGERCSLATHLPTSPARHRYNEVFTRHFANSFFISLDNKPPSFFLLLPWVALY